MANCFIYGSTDKSLRVCRKTDIDMTEDQPAFIEYLNAHNITNEDFDNGPLQKSGEKHKKK